MGGFRLLHSSDKRVITSADAQRFSARRTSTVAKDGAAMGPRSLRPARPRAGRSWSVSGRSVRPQRADRGRSGWPQRSRHAAICGRLLGELSELRDGTGRFMSRRAPFT
jgi:hypothetical protein